MEGFKGRKFFAHERIPPPARQRGAEQKIAFTFFNFTRANFSFRRKRQFSARHRRRFAAAGGGSSQISLFGFVYQIW
jgi:hypothetical protein